jgi:hypothetical protein
MAIVKSIPVQRIINGEIIKGSESSIVSEKSYKTNGEYTIVVKSVDICDLTLDSSNTDHVVVKALTNVNVIPSIGKIDEEYDNVLLQKGACVEFKFILHNWYILSSDGLKGS